MILPFLFTLFFNPATALDPRFDEWAKISEPSPGPAKVIGFYSAGCLDGAHKLTLDGPGFTFMRTSRKKYYGHPEMENYLQNLSARLQKQKLPLMLVGNVSPPRGGPMAIGHNSHQGGIDVDIWFLMRSKRPTPQQKESMTAPLFVKNRKTLKSNWSPSQVKLIATAADFENVNRIFVAPAIKKYFCEHFPKAPWLYRIRAWWGHEEHLHVRLNCPADSPLCQTQTPLNPADPGCGEELDWWFSQEADDEWQKMITSPVERTFPQLPAECEALVR